MRFQTDMGIRCLVLLFTAFVAPASAFTIPWKGAGWYVQSREQAPEWLFGGPYKTRDECRARIAQLVKQRSRSDEFYCTHRPSEGDDVILPWRGPGWYLVDLVWQRITDDGPFPALEECEATMVAMTKRDPESAAYCWRRDTP